MLKLMPSGGVSIDNVDKWINNGAFAVGIGSALTKGVSNGDYSSVEAVARRIYGQNRFYYKGSKLGSDL